MGDLDEIEVLELAIVLHGIEGSFGELRRRGGEHHSTFEDYYDLKDYQKALKRHFNGDKFFYRSQECDKDNFCERIKDAAEDNDMEKIQTLVNAYNNLEAGYYDCNGNLEMSEVELESDSLTGYRYDVYSYCFGFKLENKYSFKEIEETEND